MREEGTLRVKKGLAEMLKGGVIMDVTTAEQARIAEEAGACAVMALERVPADIRRDGGVARMSDPEMIVKIQKAVSIPVMAKARIGHFVEAQILEALEIDYIDESEVLTPADEAHHINKWNFKVPFVCGATNLGEALRRISEGAAMIRTKGEAGTGNVVEAVRHMRTIIGEMRARRRQGAPRSSRPDRLGCQARHAAGGQFLGGRYRHSGGRGPHDATGRRWRLRGLRHLQERRSGRPGQGDRAGHHALPRRQDLG
jgi:pyridoxal 5'-phosphate synthase subunit Pdx1